MLKHPKAQFTPGRAEAVSRRGSSRRARGALAGILTTVAALVLAGCGSGASGGSDESISVGVQEPFIMLPMFVAQDQGFLADHGISELKTVTYTDLPSTTAALSMGQLDVASVPPPIVATSNAASSGALLKYIAPATLMNGGWVVPEGSDIPSASEVGWENAVKAMEGKRIGVVAVGGVWDRLMRQLFTEVGIDPDAQEYVATGVGSAAGAAMDAGAADVFLADIRSVLQMEADGARIVLNTVEGEGPDGLTQLVLGGYVASETTIKDRADVLTKFTEALKEAREFIADPANKDAVIDTIVSAVEVEESEAEKLYEQRQIFDFELTEDVVSNSIKDYAQLGLIKEPLPTYDEIVDKLND